MNLRRLDELRSPPVVGRRYLVPAVLHGMIVNIYGVWPVLLPAHADHEIGQPLRHYHVDPRFVSAMFWRWLEDLKTYAVPDGNGGVRGCVAKSPYELLRHIVIEAKTVATLMPMKCEREGLQSLDGFGMLAKLWQIYGGRRCAVDKRSGGWICPHKGVSLSSVKPSECGLLTCPGHGLVISAHTGVVLSLADHDHCARTIDGID